MRKKLFLFLGVLSICVKAQEHVIEDSTLNTIGNKVKNNFSLRTLPVVYYTPETRWGFGVAGFFRFKLKREPDSVRHSNILFSLTVTTIKQIVLGAPFQFWLKKEKYNIYGEPSYQDINMYYYGVGNNNSKNYVEKYYSRFFRLRLSVLYKAYPHIYAGIRYNMDYTDLYRAEKGGQLIKHTVPGSTGGIASGLGATFKFDNRDNQFYPMKGWYVEFFAVTNSKYLGSTYRFDKYSLDVTYNIPVPVIKGTLGINAYGVITTGNTPFYQLGMLGGEKKLRGIYEGKYRDKNCWVLQTEYRRDLFWRIGFVAFYGLGDIANRFKDYSYKHIRVAWGAGLRGNIDKKQHLNLRLDVGTSGGIVNYYFTIGEAF